MSAHVQQDGGEEPPAATQTVGVQKWRTISVPSEGGRVPNRPIAPQVRPTGARSFCLQVMSSTGGGEAGPAACEAQAVLVSLSETPAVNTVEVNVYELLNNSVAFLAQDKPPRPGSQV